MRSEISMQFSVSSIIFEFVAFKKSLIRCIQADALWYSSVDLSFYKSFIMNIIFWMIRFGFIVGKQL